MMNMNQIARVGLVLGALLTVGCNTVAQNRRAKLADPMMTLTDDQLEQYRKSKLYNTREAAAGGDGAAAGGGCGCQ